MRKITILAVAAFILAAFPATTFAHEVGAEANANIEINGKALGHFKEHKRAIVGEVTATTSTNLSVKAKNSTTYTVTVNGSTKIEKAFGAAIAFTDINIGDKVAVKGLITETTITARHIVVTPANTHPAKAKGEVTAVSGNTVTLKTTHDGVVSNVTVKTDANTQVNKADGTAGTNADVTVGSKVKVKGFWDEVLNVLNAIKIRIF